MNERNPNGWQSVGPHRDFESPSTADDHVDDPSWEFDAGLKHLFVGRPRKAICILALTHLAGELAENSEVEVPDTSTCWLCLAIEDWAAKEGVSVESAAIPW